MPPVVRKGTINISVGPPLLLRCQPYLEENEILHRMKTQSVGCQRITHLPCTSEFALSKRRSAESSPEEQGFPAFLPMFSLALLTESG